jgi:DNA-binding response OmpR family regulator
MNEANTVLVVEDDPTIRGLIRSALVDEGLRVEVAVDGRAALELAQNRAPALVLLDMMLPDMTGGAVAAGLKARHGPDVPIIVVTADGRAADKAASVGAVDHITKPFDVDKLVEMVRQRLRPP